LPSEASAAQKPPVNTICSQCGSMLPKGARACNFCEQSESFSQQEVSTKSKQGNPAVDTSAREEWRGELNQRLQAYRARRRKPDGMDGQTQLPFEHPGPASASVACATNPMEESRSEKPAIREEFAFTLAIGRPPRKSEEFETHLLIDVSVPPPAGEEQVPSNLAAEPADLVDSRMIPCASIDERRSAALIDVACLGFAYGAFLMLFGSLGGHFTLSKLSATVYFLTFAFVYVQYFGLFTVFGGTTPGMMIRGLRVTSFSGDAPAPRQYLLRAAGYMLSAGTLFLGFFWALWDEDGLTWHDRISNTYLGAPDIVPDMESSHAAATH
jgi:uncharacterized RDD family membrane protein YckC